MGRALLLAGGTALGADQVESMEQLMGTYGLGAYDVVAGVSVGSVNGAMFAANKLSALRALWEKVDGVGFFMAPDLFGPPGLMSLGPLRRKLKRHVCQSDIDPRVHFTVGVTDFQADKFLDLPSTGFDGNEEFLDGIMGSAAQPFIMHGYEVQTAGKGSEKHWCFDGGVKHVIPRVVEPASFEHIDVILCNPPLRLPTFQPDQLDDILEVGLRAFDIMANENVLVSDVRRLKDWEEDGARVTIYAPRFHDKEFDASHATVMKRLDEIGPWMWQNPWTPDSFLEHWRAS